MTMMPFFRSTVAIILLISFTYAILDDDIIYDLKWQPELATSLDLMNTFAFTSKRKETYSCVLPTVQAADTALPDYILNTELEPFFESLQAQSAGSCVYRLDPYWTYELCHGTHIRQYHETKVAGKRTIHQEYFLGYYHADNQEKLVDDQNQPVAKIHYRTFENREVPMLAVRYTHGTKCDINSDKPRETAVFYVCQESGRTGILSFQEVSSCSYEMIIASPTLCKIPAFNVVEPNRHTINCYPHNNAGQQPRNLQQLESEHQAATSKGGVAQFTMTSADGTTFIISYQYINDGEGKDSTDNANSETATPSTASEQQLQQPAETVQLSFLQKFLSGEECLTGGSGWWRYEICYAKHVLQIHEEGQQRTSILLGSWNREKHIEWMKSKPEKKSPQPNKERQYVSLFYTDGETCELTNLPRVVEVKLKCVKRGDQSQTATMYLVEPQTCSYILGVESPLFCDLIDHTDEYGIPDPAMFVKGDERQ